MLLGLGIFPIILKLALYIGGLVAAILAITWKPRIGLYYLVPLLPLQTTRFKIHEFPAGDKMVLVLMGSVMIGLMLQRKLIPRYFPLKYVIFLFAFYTFFTLWTGTLQQHLPAPFHFDDERLQDWINYLLFPLLYMLALNAFENEKQIRLMLLLMCFSLVVMTRSFAASVSGRDLSRFSNEIRDAGPIGFAGENGLGAFEAQVSVFMLGLLAYEKRWKARLLMYLLLAGNIYCLLYAFSRGAYLAFAAGLLVLGLVKERKYLGVLLIIGIGYQAVIPNSVQERVAMTVDSSGNLESSAGDRVLIWKDALNLFLESPIIGSGFATYRFMNRVGHYADTHNLYLKIFVEDGIVGIALFLAMLFGLLGIGIRTYRMNPDPFVKSLGLGLIAMMTAVIVVNIFGDRWSFLQVNGVLWTLVGCTVRAHLLAREAAWEEERLQDETLAGETGVERIVAPAMRA